MTISLKHSFNSTVADGDDSSLVQPSNWNEEHVSLFTASGTGAVTRTLDAKVGETVSVKDFGAVGNGVTDDTAAIQAALTAAQRVYFPTPSVSYLISSINIPANRTLVTDGVSTKFQQKLVPLDTRVFYVMGPNVTIGDMTVQGNIATDEGEQHHAIFINSGTAGVNLYNIRVGNIRGINLRGDVVYIGQSIASGTTSGVSVASADGNNILRNVVSIVGGSDIEIGQVTGPAVGFMHIDIEPDGEYTGNCVNIRVGQVTGKHIGAVVNTPSGDLVFNENIQFGEVNLDPTFSTQSTPAYLAPGAVFSRRAVHLRSTKDVSIGSLRVNGFDGAAIWLEPGGVSNISVVIGQAFLSNCNIVDGDTYSYVVCNNVTFGYLNADTPLVTSVTQRILQGDNCVVNSGTFYLGSSGSLIRSGSNNSVRNSDITFKSGATGTYVALGATNAQLKNCTVTGAEYLAGFTTGLDVENSTVTTSVATLNTVTKATYKNSTINSQYCAFATGTRVYTEAIAFGNYFLWVDATGVLRIENGAPTGDTDGTVVGTQT